MKRSAFHLHFILMFLFGCDTEKKLSPAKKTLKIHSISNHFIELEDGSHYSLGENIFNRLTTLLQESREFIVVVDTNIPGPPIALPDEREGRSIVGKVKDEKIVKSDRLRFNFPPTPALEISSEIESLTFRAGSKDLQRFYGFTSNFKTPWNDGTMAKRNEFPKRSHELQRSWFGKIFEPIGSPNKNTLTGVDFGEQGEIELVVGSISYRRKIFRSSAQLKTRLDFPWENRSREKTLIAKGKGFLFGSKASLLKLNVEFSVLKRDALKKVLERSAELLADEIKN